MMISLKILCWGAHICGIWAIKYMYVIFLKHVKNETDDHLQNFFKECKVKKKFFSQDQLVILICETPDIRNRMWFSFLKQHPSFQRFVQDNLESNAKFTWKLCWWVLWTSVIGWHVQYILKNICVDCSLSWLGSSFLWSRRGGLPLMVRWMLMILMTVMRNC